MADARDQEEMESAKTIAILLMFIPLGIACEFWEFLERSWQGIAYSFSEIADELEKLKSEEVSRG